MATVPGAEEFRSLAGITYRQLDTWTSNGYLHAIPRRRGEGSGVPRLWKMEELVVAQRIKRLLDAGVVLSKAAEIARAGTGSHQVTPHVKIELSP